MKHAATGSPKPIQDLLRDRVCIHGILRATPPVCALRVRLSLLLGLLAILLVEPSLAWAVTYYVAPSGNDKNAGTSWAQAWGTLKHAGRRAIAGDEVIIRKGPVPYGYLLISNSGKLGKPITFRGEHASDPPIITGAIRVTNWIGPDKNGVWKSRNLPKISRLAENNRMVPPATSPACNDGRWYWGSSRTLYYRPPAGKPSEHEIWASSSGGGIVIGSNSWIVVQDLYAWFGLGAGVSIKSGHHNIVRGFRAKWHWQGVHISGAAHDNLVENCLVEENREGVYILRGAFNNKVRACRAFRNGNAPLWSNGDRAGIAIGEKGPNAGNIVEDCEVAFNGSPNSDPGLIAYDAPQTVLARNHVHDNFGSGIYVTFNSDDSRVTDNIVERNGIPAVQGGYKGIAGLSVRMSRRVLVEDNRIIDNWVAPDSRWSGKGLGPKGGLDLQGHPGQDMTGIVFRNNQVSGTRGGPDVYISSAPNTRSLVIEPGTQTPRWMKRNGAHKSQSEPADAAAQ